MISTSVLLTPEGRHPDTFGGSTALSYRLRANFAKSCRNRHYKVKAIKLDWIDITDFITLLPSPENRPRLYLDTVVRAFMWRGTLLNVSPLRLWRRPRCRSGVGLWASQRGSSRSQTRERALHTLHRLFGDHESGVETNDWGTQPAWMCQDCTYVILRGVWTDADKCVKAQPRLNSLLVTGERWLREI